jgi:hypothetical protein
VLISLARVGSVFVVCAGLGAAASLLVAGLRTAPCPSWVTSSSPAAIA